MVVALASDVFFRAAKNSEEDDDEGEGDWD